MTRKVGHTDLVLGVRSGFISRCVHARLQDSVYSAVTLCADLQTHTQTAYMNGSASRANMIISIHIKEGTFT